MIVQRSFVCVNACVIIALSIQCVAFGQPRFREIPLTYSRTVLATPIPLTRGDGSWSGSRRVSLDSDGSHVVICLSGESVMAYDISRDERVVLARLPTVKQAWTDSQTDGLFAFLQEKEGSRHKNHDQIGRLLYFAKQEDWLGWHVTWSIPLTMHSHSIVTQWLPKSQSHALYDSMPDQKTTNVTVVNQRGDVSGAWQVQGCVAGLAENEDGYQVYYSVRTQRKYQFQIKTGTLKTDTPRVVAPQIITEVDERTVLGSACDAYPNPFYHLDRRCIRIRGQDPKDIPWIAQNPLVLLRSAIGGRCVHLNGNPFLEDQYTIAFGNPPFARGPMHQGLYNRAGELFGLRIDHRAAYVQDSVFSEQKRLAVTSSHHTKRIGARNIGAGNKRTYLEVRLWDLTDIIPAPSESGSSRSTAPGR